MDSVGFDRRQREVSTTHLLRNIQVILTMDYGNLYPYLNDHISFRLSDETVQLRNLKRIVPAIIELNGICHADLVIGKIARIGNATTHRCSTLLDVTLRKCSKV